MFSPGEGYSSNETVPASQAIITAIAAHEGVDVTEIEPPEYKPLYSVVNPEALDALFRPAATRTSNQSTGSRAGPTGRVVIEYEGYEITVDGDAQVELVDLSADDTDTDADSIDDADTDADSIDD